MTPAIVGIILDAPDADGRTELHGPDALEFALSRIDELESYVHALLQEIPVGRVRKADGGVIEIYAIGSSDRADRP